MNPTYSTFDTLTIGEINSELASQDISVSNPTATKSTATRREPTVLARLPRLSSKFDHSEPVSDLVDTKANNESLNESRPLRTVQQRIDRAASPLHRNNQHYQSEELTRGADPTSEKSALDKLSIFREGLRFDTSDEVVPPTTDPISEWGQVASAEVRISDSTKTLVTPKTKQSAPLGFATEREHWSDNWLLQLEAAIMPHSRLILLAAVIAALGLTFLLLQGNRTTGVGDAIKPTPMADHLLKTSSLINYPSHQESILIENNLAEKNTIKNNWVDAGLVDVDLLESASATNHLAANQSNGTRSSGPQGLPASVSRSLNNSRIANQTLQPTHAARAQLAGNIMPVEPYRTTNPTVSTPPEANSTGYPQTANARSQWPTSPEGGTIR